MGRDKALQFLTVGAATVLALAASHVIFHWTLLTEAFARRLLY